MSANSGDIDLNSNVVSIEGRHGINVPEAKVSGGGGSEAETLTEPLKLGQTIIDDDRNVDGAEAEVGMVIKGSKGLSLESNGGDAVCNEKNDDEAVKQSRQAQVSIQYNGKDDEVAELASGEVVCDSNVDKCDVEELMRDQGPCGMVNSSSVTEGATQIQNADASSMLDDAEPHTKSVAQLPHDIVGMEVKVAAINDSLHNENLTSNTSVSDVVTSDELENQAMEVDDAEPHTESVAQLPHDILSMEVKVAEINDSLQHENPTSNTRVSDVVSSDELENQAMEVDDADTETMGNYVSVADAEPNIGNEPNEFNLVVDLNPYPSTDCSGVANVKLAASKQEFCVSDLVWGKVRSHPWWPGQICDPSASSAKAKKYLKKDCYLIAYFGDHTFAWNDASRIKPFRAHFSQMEKQSTMEDFRYAVDCALEEYSRRVEFGLACSCVSEELYAKLKTQLIINAGIREESSRRDGGDSSLSATSFEPVELVNCIKALAQSPSGVAERLEHVTARAQLLAFYCSKGYSQLPEFNMLGGLLESDEDILLFGEKKNHSEVIEDAIPHIKNDKLVTSGEGKSGSQVSSSRKRKHTSGDSMHSNKKEKSLSDLLAEKGLSTPNGKSGSERKAVSKSISQSSGKKRKAVDDMSDAVDDMSDDLAVKHRKVHLSTGVADKPTQVKQDFKVGDSIRRAASQLNGSSPILKYGPGMSQKTAVKNQSKKKSSSEKSQSGKLTQMDLSSPDEILSQLCLSARDPMKGYSFLNSVVSFFSEFRNFVSLEDPSSEEHEQPLEQVFGGKSRKKSTKPGINETSKRKVMSDSYWTDRIVQTIPEEQSSLENQNETREFLPETPSEIGFSTVDPQATLEISLNVDSKQQPACEKLLEEVKPLDHLDESSKQDPSPTALILNFKDFDSVPSEANLNKIFRRFGPLNESETEVLKKSSRAKVVFKRRFDAESAFSSAGKYSIFGPSLVSYRLKYMSSTPSKASPNATKRGRKDTMSVEGNAM